MSGDDQRRGPTTTPVGWDPWRHIAPTPARIGLGRAGAALRTPVHLAFQAAHAAARDAVMQPWDPDELRATIPDLIAVRSRARDRQEYLLRPDLGRQLDPDSLAALEEGRWDLAVVITNGLSSEAVRRHGAGLIAALGAAFAIAPALAVAPWIAVPDGRVAIGDPIGRRLGARAVLIVVGERPGLSAADSLGLYLTLLPDDAAARSDADRNCISNVHPPHGLDYATAAARASWATTAVTPRASRPTAASSRSPLTRRTSSRATRTRALTCS